MRVKKQTRIISGLVSEDVYTGIIQATDNLQMTISEFMRNALEKELDCYLSNNHKELIEEV